MLRGKKWRKKRAKGPDALWIPAVRLCGRASAQHDAKGCIFSFCECDLKKVALTKVARTLLLQTAPALASFPVIDGSSNRTGKQNFCQANPSWACAYAPNMEETCKTLPFRRSSSERRTEQFPKAAAFGALSWFVLCRAAKNEHKCGTAHAQRCVRVKRRSCLKSSYAFSLSPLSKIHNFSSKKT